MSEAAIRIREEEEQMEAIKASLPDASIIVVCIDESCEQDRNGRLYVRSRREPCGFTGMLELLQKMEQFYDRMDYPQASTDSRSLNPSSDKKEKDSPGVFRAPRKNRQQVVLSGEEMREKRGREATFLVRIRYRQSASWQGQVTWMEQDKTMSFHSTLELVKMMDSAMDGRRTKTIL